MQWAYMREEVLPKHRRDSPDTWVDEKYKPEKWKERILKLSKKLTS